MLKLKISVIGCGFVGKAIINGFDETLCDITPIDIKYDTTVEDTNPYDDIFFVCLPTPMNKDGSCNVDIIENELDGLNQLTTTKTIVVKSTILPGTTKYWNEKYESLDIVFNPEFLTEANAVDDFENQTRIILGGSLESTTKLKQLYSTIFRKTSKIIKTDSTTAELVKYVTNAFLSTKVSFANEVYELCGGMGLDYDKIIEYATYDERLGLSHWGVPGPDGDFGFGGHCFPKDLSALLHLTEKLGTINNVLSATQETNNNVRKNRDWEGMKGRAVV